MSQEDLAQRLGVSFHTVREVGNGKPGTAFGTYAHALWILGLLATLTTPAEPALDEEGMALEASERRVRGGHQRASISNEF